MKMRYFGDTYDVVKQSLLRWLAPLGDWGVHPMFTENVSHENAEAFSAFLGARLISTDVLTGDTNRPIYFRSAQDCRNHLFLDPDTGIIVNSNKNKSNKQSYIFLPELIDIVNNRPNLLTLVFDQSVPRGKERQALQAKIDVLKSNGIHGTAYVSHTNFILITCDNELIKKAGFTLRKESLLPEARFI